MICLNITLFISLNENFKPNQNIVIITFQNQQIQIQLPCSLTSSTNCSHPRSLTCSTAHLKSHTSQKTRSRNSKDSSSKKIHQDAPRKSPSMTPLIPWAAKVMSGHNPSEHTILSNNGWINRLQEDFKNPSSELASRRLFLKLTKGQSFSNLSMPWDLMFLQQKRKKSRMNSDAMITISRPFSPDYPTTMKSNPSDPCTFTTKN